MKTRLSSRPKMDERVALLLPADEKRRLFDLAAKKRLSASEVMRRGIALIAQQAA